jgi:hypothetical protein
MPGRFVPVDQSLVNYARMRANSRQAERTSRTSSSQRNNNQTRQDSSSLTDTATHNQSRDRDN